MEKNNSYLQQFLTLKCAGDILNIVSPINRYEKEISESWGILRKIKPLVMRDKGYYDIWDLCAGNALTSVISAFLLPVRASTAVDIKKRERNWKVIRNFEYEQDDIYASSYETFLFDERKIFISSHPCKHAVRIIEIFNCSRAKALCIIPCCNSQVSLPAEQFLQVRLGKYDTWTYYLASLITNMAKVSIQTDDRILSPKNNVIYAER